MSEITLAQPKELSVKVEDWGGRYDIEKNVYEDLYLEHGKVHQFIENNPAHFQSMEAFCLSGYIIICLLVRINEMSESDDCWQCKSALFLSIKQVFL